MDRSCPRCAPAKMNRRKIGPFEIDVCPTCCGTYLDFGEGALFGLDDAVLRDAPVVRESERRCPDHGRPMKLHALEVEGGVVGFEVSECGQGIFLDVGEPNLLAARVKHAEDETLRDHHVDHLQCLRSEESGCLLVEEEQWLRGGVPVDAIDFENADSAPGHACRKCSAQTKEVQFPGLELLGAAAEPIVLEWCPSCRATWLEEEERPVFVRMARIALSNRAEAESREGKAPTPSRARTVGPSAVDASNLAAARASAERTDRRIVAIQIEDLKRKVRRVSRRNRWFR